MRRFSLFLSLVLLSSAPAANAIDHGNLDEDRPVRMEDAYPVASGEWAAEAGAGFTLERRRSDRGVFPLEVLYGAYPNLQLGLGTTLSTNPHELDGQTKSGDLHLSGLYNFNQETLTLPALGAKLSLNFPTGVDSAGVDVRVKGLVTKSLGRLSVHFNPAYEFLQGTKGGERDGRYEFILGASYPLGAPTYTRTTLVGDVFTEQAPRHGDANIGGVEFGFRHQLTLRLVLDAGLGTEFAGPADRSLFFLTAGISSAF